MPVNLLARLGPLSSAHVFYSVITLSCCWMQWFGAVYMCFLLPMSSLLHSLGFLQPQQIPSVAANVKRNWFVFAVCHLPGECQKAALSLDWPLGPRRAFSAILTGRKISFFGHEVHLRLTWSSTVRTWQAGTATAFPNTSEHFTQPHVPQKDGEIIPYLEIVSLGWSTQQSEVFPETLYRLIII